MERPCVYKSNVGCSNPPRVAYFNSVLFSLFSESIINSLLFDNYKKRLFLLGKFEFVGSAQVFILRFLRIHPKMLEKFFLENYSF